jgi:hypothetical protein
VARDKHQAPEKTPENPMRERKKAAVNLDRNVSVSVEGSTARQTAMTPSDATNATIVAATYLHTCSNIF